MCDCVKKMDEALAPRNGRIAIAIQITPDMGLRYRLLVATEKLDESKRKPIPSVTANYCPFCGEHLQD